MQPQSQPERHCLLTADIRKLPRCRTGKAASVATTVRYFLVGVAITDLGTEILVPNSSANTASLEGWQTTDCKVEKYWFPVRKQSGMLFYTLISQAKRPLGGRVSES